MATPTWNQLAAPNFSAGNSLIVQAMDQLTKAGEGLQGVAKSYKDTLYKRNLGAIQEYVNSAKTPEELESEGFRTGLARLTGTMAGEYDTLAKAQLVDKAYDSLLSRKANQVSIARNEFGLNQDQLEANQKQAISNIFAINDPDMRKAAIDQAVKDKQFNSSLYLQTLAAELTGKTNQQTYDFNAETWNTRKEALTLGNDATRNRMKNDDRAAKTAEINAQANMLQAEAAAARAEAERNKNKNAYIGTAFAAIDTAKKDVADNIYGSGLNTDPAKSWKKWHEQATEGIGLLGGKADAAPNTIAKLIDSHPVLSKLPDNLKILHAENALREGRDSEWLTNPIGFTSKSEDDVYKKALEKSYKDFNQQARTIEDNSTIPIYRKMVLEHAQKTNAPSGYAAAKDLGLDELTIYKAGISSQLAAQAKLKYASSDKSIPESQFIENEINIATNPDYGAENKSLFPKEPEPDYSKVSRPSPGRGAGGIKQKSLGVLPPTTGNTIADPSQEPSALAAQEQRMNNRARLNLEAQKALRNGQPFVVPAITDKLEETKPRELTPAEIAQGGRMEQAAMVRLVGTKLKEKQAEVQKQFPDTPLKQLAKAATPVPSPLIPMESQNAFRVKENNLALDFRTGKGTPTKEPVPMPKVDWKEPVQAVTLNPIYAQLPQYKATVTYVPDGDTLRAKSKDYKTTGLSDINCRIDSIDTPETAKPQYGKKGQPYGEEAAKILQRMVLNKEISIRVTKPTDGKSNNGRDVCQIEVAGKDVSVELLRAGAAWLYKEYNHYGESGFDLESAARKNKLGLWGLPNPVYPQDFRHNGYQNP